MTTRIRLAAASCFLLALAACGGDSGTTGADGSPSTGSPGSGGSGGGSSGGSGATPTGLTYEIAVNPTTSADMLAQLNSEGARGYAFVNPIGLPGDNGTDYALYIDIGNATYTYEVLATATTSADVLAQANAEGARGFRRATDLTVGTVYFHVVGSTAQYSYESLTPGTTSAAFLAQANAEGARGFSFTGEYVTGGVLSALYAKDSTSSAVYAYVAQPQSTSAAAFLTQANAQGALGYRFTIEFAFADETAALYVKDTTQSAQFDYSAQASVNLANDYVAQANAQGANGTVLIGELAFGTPVTFQDFYVLPQNCTGLLCGPTASL